jgi:hypothetical protein
MIGMRYNDFRDGTNVAEEVLEKYKEAWKAKGMIAQSGLCVDWYFVNQDKTAPPSDICFTAWSERLISPLALLAVCSQLIWHQGQTRT